LTQMWNALGDVAEKIGAAFIPGITDSTRAVKKWAEENQEKIGRFAETAVAHITYFKDILWAFVKFLGTDWRAGIKVGLGVSLEIFKGFGESLVVIMTDVASRAWRAFVKEFGEGLGRWLIEASKPKGVLGKVLGVTPVGIAKRLAMMKAGIGLVEGARAVKSPEGPTLGEKLKRVWKDVSVSIKDIIPPELAEEFEIPLAKLEERLSKIGTIAEEIEDPMKKALVDVPEKSSRAIEEATGKLRQWASDARDIWSNLADAAVGALDGMSDALTDLVLTGKADFASLADSILKDLTKIMIKSMMAQALGAVFPALAPVPSAQHGGTVTKTGLAVIHKGEEFSGVGKENAKPSVTLNINVNAIDAAGTYQFLNKNKRAIANLIQGSIVSNHSLRRTKGWK